MVELGYTAPNRKRILDKVQERAEREGVQVWAHGRSRVERVVRRRAHGEVDGIPGVARQGFANEFATSSATQARDEHRRAKRSGGDAGARNSARTRA